MADRKPAVVIVGAGLMGHWHGRMARRAGASVRAIVDKDPARAQALASQLGARAYVSIDEVPVADAQRVLQICTPLATHVEYCQRGLARGYDVLCEKPLAASAGEVRQILQQAERCGRLVWPVHQFAMQASVQRSIAELQSGGQLRHLSFVFCTAGGMHQPGLTPEQLLLEIIPHPLSILARLPSAEITRLKWTILAPASGEFLASAAMGHASVSILISTSVRPTEASCTIYTQLRTIRHDFYHGFRTVQVGTPGRRDKVLRPFRLGSAVFGNAAVNLARRALRGEAAYPGLLDLHKALYQASRQRTSPLFPAHEIAAVYEARDCIARELAVR